MSLAETCDCDLTIGGIHRFTRKSYNEKLANDMIGGLVDIGFEPRTSGGKPAQKLAAIRPLLPNTKTDTFKANTHGTMLKRISKSLAKSGSKARYVKGGGEETFASTAEEIRDNIVATGGTMAHDFIEIKKAIETRLNNLKDCLVVLEKVLLETKIGPSDSPNGMAEFKTYKKLLKEVIDMAKKEISILAQSYDIETHSLDHIIRKNADMKKTLEMYQIKPGSAATGKLLAQYLHGMANIADTALLVQKWLKDLNLTLKDYESLNYSEMQKKALLLSGNTLKKKAQVIDIIRHLASFDTKKKGIVKEIKGGNYRTSGSVGGFESGGSVEPFLPKSYESKVKEESKQLDQLNMAYSAQLKEIFSEVYKAMDVFVKLIGKEVKYDDHFAEFVLAYEKLAEIDSTPNLKAILGFTNDHTSVTTKSRYLNDTSVAIAKMKALKVSGEAETKLNKIIKLLEEFLKLVETYGHKKEATEKAFGGKPKNAKNKGPLLKRGIPKDKFVPVGGSLGFSESVKALNYYADLNKLKSTMVNLAKGFERDTKDFDSLLYNALEGQKEINEKEYKKAMADLEKNYDDLGSDKVHIKAQVKDYLDHAYAMKSKMWLVAQAVEIYLKHFNYLSLTEYEEFIELNEILDPIKIIKDSSSATIAALLEPGFIPKDHEDPTNKYYSYLAKVSAGTNGFTKPGVTGNIFKSKDEPIAIINRDFVWATYKQKIKDAGVAFNLLKNVLAIFTRIGDKIGKNKQIEIRKKTSMTPTQMWEALSEFLFTSFYEVYYDGQLSTTKFNFDKMFSVDFAKPNIIDMGTAMTANFGSFYIGNNPKGLKAKTAIFITPRDDLLCLKALTSNHAKLFMIKSHAGNILTLETDTNVIKANAPFNNGDILAGIDLSPAPIQAAIRWMDNARFHDFPSIKPATDYAGWKAIDERLMAIRDADCGRDVMGHVGTVVAVSATTNGFDSDVFPGYTDQSICLATGALSNVHGVVADFGTGVAGGGGFTLASIVAKSNIPVVLSHLSEAKKIIALFNNYTNFMAWYYSVALGQKTFATIDPAADRKVSSILAQFEDNSASKFLKSFVDRNPGSTGVYDIMVSGAKEFRDFITLLSTNLKELYPVALGGRKETITSSMIDTPSKIAGITKYVQEIYDDLDGRYAAFMDKVKACFLAVPGLGAHPEAAILTVIFNKINHTSRFVASNGTPALLAFDDNEYNAAGVRDGTVPPFVFGSVRNLPGGAANFTVSALHLMVYVKRDDIVAVGGVSRAANIGGFVWEVVDCSTIFTAAAIDAYAGMVFDIAPAAGAKQKALNYVRGAGCSLNIVQLPNIAINPDATNIPALINQVEVYVDSRKNMLNMGFIANAVTKEERQMSDAAEKRYLLAREGSKAIIVDPTNATLKSANLKPLLSFGQEHALFRTLIKAMFSKVNQAIGVHNIFNSPGALTKFSPERIIMGASNYTETISEALELYIRLPPYIEFYKKIFLSQKDLSTDKFDFKMTPKDSEFSITFLPEMRGTVFGGLFDVLWRKIDESEFYSEVECSKIIEECNHIYDKFKGPNLVFNVITSLVEEVNARYGKTKITDIKFFKDYVRETTEYENKFADDENILPGEDGVDIPGALAINNMGMAGAIDKSYYDMTKTKDLIYDFMSRLTGYLDADNNDKLLDKASFRTFIKNIDAEYKHSKDQREKFEIVVRGIRGVNTGMSTTSIINIVIHELITTPLNILSEILVILKDKLKDIDDFDLKSKFDKTYTALFPAAKLNNRLADMKTEAHAANSTYKEFYLRVKADGTSEPTIIKKHFDTTAFFGAISPAGTINNMDAYLRAIDAAAAQEVHNDINYNVVAIMELVNWGEQYGQLLDRLGALSDLNLFVVKSEGKKVTFEYSEFKSRVEDILEKTKQLIDFIRYDTDVKDIEIKYFQLEKELYKEIILGKNYPNNLSKFKTYVNEGRDLIEKYSLECSDALLRRARYSMLDNDGNVTGDKSNSVLLSIVSKEKAKLTDKKDDKSTKAANSLDFLTKTNKLWNNDRVSGHQSLLLQFNSIIDHFLKDTFDWSTNKVYSKLLYTLTAGSLTSDIQQGFKTFSISNDVNTAGSLLPTLFIKQSSPYTLVSNVSYLLNTFISSYNKTSKAYVMETFSELSDPYKEKLKNTLPIYMQLLGRLVNKAELLKTCFPKTEVHYLNPTQFKLGPFKGKNLVWAIGITGIELIFGLSAAIVAGVAGVSDYQSICNFAFPPIKPDNIHTHVNPQTAGAPNLFNAYKLRNSKGEIIVMKVGGGDNAWINGLFSKNSAGAWGDETDFFNDWIKTGLITVGKDETGAGVAAPGFYTRFSPSAKLIKERDNQRKSFEKFIISLGLKMDTTYSAEGFIKATQKDRYDEVIASIDKISSNVSGLMSNIDSVLKELDDVPLHGELNQRFIEQYKSANGKIPFMPLSITSYHYANDLLFPEYGSDEFKLSYATRGVRGALNLKKIDMDAFPVLDSLLDEYAGVYKKIDKKLVGDILESMTYMSRYLCFYKANASMYFQYQARPASTAISPIFQTKEVNGTLKMTLDLIESTDQNKQKGILGNNEQGTSNDRNTIIKVNIMDLNINPVSILALYRQVPFLGANIFAFNCDLVIAKVLGIALLKDKPYHDFIRKDPLSLAVNRIFNLLLTLPTKETITPADYLSIVGGALDDSDKYSKIIYKDGYFKNQIVQSLLLFSESDSPVHGAARSPVKNLANEFVPNVGLTSLETNGVRANHPFDIRRMDSTKDVHICTIVHAGATNAAEKAQGNRAAEESLARLNLFGVQQLHFIEVMYNVTKQYLVSKILLTQTEDSNPNIISSSNILADYLGITK